MNSTRINQLIGANIKRIRKARKMSQGSLAKQLGMQRPSVTKIEKGQQDLHCPALIKMCSILACETEDILF